MKRREDEMPGGVRYPSGSVYGPDGEPVRRTRAHALFGFVEPVEVLRHGREAAMFDEETAHLGNGGSVVFEE